jgi:hypothetical protein
MFDECDQPVIIDFDSCCHNGQKLGRKMGTPGWFMEGAEFASFDNDLFGLSKLREYVMN